MCFCVFSARFLLLSFVWFVCMCMCVFVWILTFNTLAHAGTHVRSVLRCSYHKHRKNGPTTNYFIPFHSLPNHSKWMWASVNMCVFVFVRIHDAEWNQRIYYNQFILFFVRVKQFCLLFFYSFIWVRSSLFLYTTFRRGRCRRRRVYMRLVFYFCWSGMNWKAWS